MCLALPAEVIALKDDGENATVSLEGVRKTISLALVDDVTVGDYVLVHVGFALAKLSAEEAAETLALMAEAGVPGAENLSGGVEGAEGTGGAA